MEWERNIGECNIEMYLEAERALLPQLFAFGHPNYSHHRTYHHALFEVHRIPTTSNWKDLNENGFGGSLTADKFSTKHGSRVIETKVNRKVKVRGRHIKGGCSTDLDDMNIFVKSNHLLMKLRSVLKERIHLLTSSKHKETTLDARKKHENMIKKLVTKLGEVPDLFSSGPAKNIKCGVLLDGLIVKGLLKSDEIGETYKVLF